MISFAELARSARRELGSITQDELADKLRVSSGAVRNWESGRARPAPKHLRALAILAPGLSKSIDVMLRSYEWHPKHRGITISPATIPKDFQKAITAEAERLGIDFESALRETLAAGITSLSQQSTEEFEAMVRR